MFPSSGPEPAEDQTEQLVFQEPVPLLDHERDPDHDRGPLPRRQQRRVRHREELRLHGECPRLSGNILLVLIFYKSSVVHTFLAIKWKYLIFTTVMHFC